MLYGTHSLTGHGEKPRKSWPEAEKKSTHRWESCESEWRRINNGIRLRLREGIVNAGSFPNSLRAVLPKRNVSYLQKRGFVQKKIDMKEKV